MPIESEPTTLERAVSGRVELASEDGRLEEVVRAFYLALGQYNARLENSGPQPAAKLREAYEATQSVQLELYFRYQLCPGEAIQARMLCERRILQELGLA